MQQEVAAAAIAREPIRARSCRPRLCSLVCGGRLAPRSRVYGKILVGLLGGCVLSKFIQCATASPCSGG
jgi:hypothetical protein